MVTVAWESAPTVNQLVFDRRWDGLFDARPAATDGVKISEQSRLGNRPPGPESSLNAS